MRHQASVAGQGQPPVPRGLALLGLSVLSWTMLVGLWQGLAAIGTALAG
ncbi:hypothetical protein [Devosia elaeis]|nr:hypothetical protein [Devosia elaeis]